MNLPEQIKIGAMTYKITQDNDQYMIGAGLNGECSYNDLVITLRSTVTDERKANVLIHEVVHGMLYEAGYKDYNNEELIDLLTNILHQVLKENDFSFIKGELNEKEKDN